MKVLANATKNKEGVDLIKNYNETFNRNLITSEQRLENVSIQKIKIKQDHVEKSVGKIRIDLTLIL